MQHTTLPREVSAEFFARPGGIIDISACQDPPPPRAYTTRGDKGRIARCFLITITLRQMACANLSQRVLCQVWQKVCRQRVPACKEEMPNHEPINAKTVAHRGKAPTALPDCTQF